MTDAKGKGEPPEATLTCPRCGAEARERMPVDACVVRWECPACGAEVRPREGDCCVFCSHGTRPCPPEEAAGGC